METKLHVLGSQKFLCRLNLREGGWVGKKQFVSNGSAPGCDDSLFSPDQTSS
jgi:hypothetical protein